MSTLSRPLPKKVLTSFKNIIREAQTRGHVVANAAAAVTIQAGSNSRHREEVATPDTGEVRALFAKLDELAGQSNAQRAKSWRRYRAPISTAIYTGCRASELRGLLWEAVDFESGTVTVKQRADETGKIGSPKSASSHQVINVPALLVARLREWKAEYPHGTLVFPSWKRSVESLANIHTRCWRPLQLAAGLSTPRNDEQGKADP